MAYDPVPVPADPFNSIAYGSRPAIALRLAHCTPATGLAVPQTLVVVQPQTASEPEMFSFPIVTGPTPLHHPSLYTSSATSSVSSALFIPSLILLTGFSSTARITSRCPTSQLWAWQSAPLLVWGFQEGKVSSMSESIERGSWQMLSQYLVNEFMNTRLHW